MPFKAVISKQNEVIQIIRNSFQNKKIVHAYIFEGNNGAGKWQAALYFASILLCESVDKPCGKCQSCKRVISGLHNNLYIIEPFNNLIRKDQIEALIIELSSTSLEAGNRVYIIKEAEKMNQAASNALLKFLEEPYPNHYLLLLTSSPQLLLSTIKSRCQQIHFKPISPKAVEELLTNKGINRDIAYVLASITSSDEIADELIKGGWVTDVLDLVKALQKAKNKKQDIYVVFFKKGKFLFNESSSPINIHQMFFDIMLLLIREKIKYLHGEKNIYFSDVISMVNFESENQTVLINQIEKINEYQERIKYHVNMELLYLSLFLEL